MARSKELQQVYDRLAEPILELGILLVDVVHERENGKLFLRLLIDKKGGVGLDDCEAVSNLADPIIDNELALDSHDYFEVSSPGVDRPLASWQQMALHLDEWVEVKLYSKIEGRKSFEGTLSAVDSEKLSLNDSTTEGTAVEIKLSDISKIKRMIRF